jgi:probable addiction module antidote protein
VPCVALLEWRAEEKSNPFGESLSCSVEAPVEGSSAEDKMSEVSTRYEEGLHTALADSLEAAAYLNAALEDDDPKVFLLALRDVAEARGMAAVARDARLNRENLYKILSREGNPQLSSLNALLRTLGLRLAVEAITQAGDAAPSLAEPKATFQEKP